MKSSILAFTLLLAALISAQTPPQSFSYQALVRDGAGAAVRNQQVGVRIRLHQDSATAPINYAETFSSLSNGFGNINLAIGRGNVVSGTFAALDWSRPMYVEVGVDAAGGTAYVNLGVTQLLSVPYALYSARSAAAGSAIVSEIRDADNNTKVSTERNANENVIRFDINGSEKLRLRTNRLEFVNNGKSVALGDSTGVNNNAADYLNVYLGHGAGYGSVSAGANTFLGGYAGFGNTGNSNTFTGSSAGYSGSGDNNTFTGAGAGSASTTGSSNTFMGVNSGISNGAGSQNTFLGADAGSTNSFGNYNTFSGVGAGYNSSGSANAFFGAEAGQNNMNGSRNTYIGYRAGPTSGSDDSDNVFLGANTGMDGSGKLAIDNSRIPAPLIWGDFTADSVRIHGGLWVSRTVTGTSFVSSSDRRLKENVAPLPNALEGIGKINGVYYNYKAKAPDGNPYPQTRQIGVIAQDVEKVYPELVATQPGGYKAVDYPKLTAVLIEAVKEQQKIIVDLKDRLMRLETREGI